MSKYEAAPSHSEHSENLDELHSTIAVAKIFLLGLIRMNGAFEQTDPPLPVATEGSFAREPIPDSEEPVDRYIDKSNARLGRQRCFEPLQKSAGKENKRREVLKRGKFVRFLKCSESNPEFRKKKPMPNHFAPNYFAFGFFEMGTMNVVLLLKDNSLASKSLSQILIRCGMNPTATN